MPAFLPADLNRITALDHWSQKPSSSENDPPSSPPSISKPAPFSAVSYFEPSISYLEAKTQSPSVNAFCAFRSSALSLSAPSTWQSKLKPEASPAMLAEVQGIVEAVAASACPPPRATAAAKPSADANEVARAKRASERNQTFIVKTFRPRMPVHPHVPAFM